MPPTIPISRRGLISTLATVPIWSLGGNSWSSTPPPGRHRGRCGPLDDPLFAESRSPELADASALYDGLIGSWDIEVIDYTPNGSIVTTGEWHFGWVLEGRAVQDVLIIPGRKDRFDGMPRQGNRYGTTVRFYDPARKLWRIVWINPVNGALNILDARKDGDRIVHEGDLAPGIRLRWSFADLTAQRFHWIGEFTTDGQATWLLQAEFFARRAHAPRR
jgi:hypothetical protein